jgi:hypothetical protein
MTMPAHADPDNIVRLTSASNPVEAHILKQALDEAGIQSKVVGDFLDASVGNIPGLYPEIWVHQDDLARAQEVLGQSRAAAQPESAEESEE